ncbi:unnamed protein product [Sphagnum jensenii]|uniref:Uncharacterized protein n=1 Tax=Sphagnum jensenii TaxID=128206 RepID=A0ABP1AB78_9BRYO
MAAATQITLGLDLCKNITEQHKLLSLADNKSKGLLISGQQYDKSTLAKPPNDKSTLAKPQNDKSTLAKPPNDTSTLAKPPNDKSTLAKPPPNEGFQEIKVRF